MGRTLLRIPGWMRRLMTWEAHRLFGKPSFGWMNGEVTHFLFGRAGTPLHSGVMPLFYICVVIGLLLGVVGALWPWQAIGISLVCAFFIPPIVSASTVMLTISRWRTNEAFHELAILPFGRDALRTMILLPTGLVLRWFNLFLALYLVYPLTVLFFTTPDLFEAIVSIFLFFMILPLSAITYYFGVSGIPVGWYLAIRFYGPNAIALALFYAFRLAASFTLIPGLLIWGAHEIGWIGDGGFDLFIFVFIIYFCMSQAWELGIKIPRKWVRRDTRILHEHGFEAIRSPETLLEDEYEDNPSHIDTFFTILWPWPRIFDMGMFVEDDD